jgi:hypothetical protein
MHESEQGAQQVCIKTLFMESPSFRCGKAVSRGGHQCRAGLPHKYNTEESGEKAKKIGKCEEFLPVS